MHGELSIRLRWAVRIARDDVLAPGLVGISTARLGPSWWGSVGQNRLRSNPAESLVIRQELEFATHRSGPCHRDQQREAKEHAHGPSCVCCNVDPGMRTFNWCPVFELIDNPINPPAPASLRTQLRSKYFPP